MVDDHLEWSKSWLKGEKYLSYHWWKGPWWEGMVLSQISGKGVCRGTRAHGEDQDRDKRRMLVWQKLRSGRRHKICTPFAVVGFLGSYSTQEILVFIDIWSIYPIREGIMKLLTAWGLYKSKSFLMDQLFLLYVEELVIIPPAFCCCWPLPQCLGTEWQRAGVALTETLPVALLPWTIVKILY